MLAYLRSVWRCRYFWLALVRMDLRSRYSRSLLGLGWSLLNPVVMMAILCVVLRPMVTPEQPLTHCAVFFLAGLACWNFLVYVTIHGCQCFFQGEPYIRQYPAPLGIYPLRTALGAYVHFLIALALVLVVAACCNGAGNLLVGLALLPAVALLFVFGWALAVLAGFANVYFEDTQHLCEIGFQILFYATPIIYPEKLLSNSRLGWVLEVNPVVPFLRLLRDAIVTGQPPSLAAYAQALVVVTVLVSAAVYTLSRCQRRLVFRL
jgi:ABC-type polysaccharide/polyol phosphate export permease